MDPSQESRSRPSAPTDMPQRARDRPRFQTSMRKRPRSGARTDDDGSRLRSIIGFSRAGARAGSHSPPRVGEMADEGAVAPPAGSSTAVERTTSAPPVGPEKVVVLLKATGDAPILKQNKFKITAADKFEKVVGFLSNQLGGKRVFVYLNSAFTPSYDETVANLYAWHGVEGKLVVNYALQQAWG